MRRLLTVVLVACTTLAMTVAPAQAHNVLTGSDPKDGATLATLPDRVTLTFDQPVRPDFAQLALTGPDGTVSKISSIDVKDDEVTATLPASATAGAYVVGYQILSNDGHPVSGKITFTVTGGTGQTAAPTVTAGPERAPAGPPPAGPSSASQNLPGSGGDWVWGLLVVALLLCGLGILVVARQGRPDQGRSA